MMMRTLFLRMVAYVALLVAANSVALAQNSWTTPGGSQANGSVQMCLNASSQAVPCNAAGVLPSSVGVPSYPVNPVTQAAATPITGNAAGTTGAVVGTLAAAASKTTYICGFNVSAIGGTAPSSPITVAGLVGSSQVYQTPVNATAGQLLVTQAFSPCIPASAANTAITITTTAAAGATAVNVNSWGYQY